MAHHNNATTVCKNFLQCRHGTTDTCVVCNVTIFIQWHIEVNTDNSLLTGKIELIDFHISFYLFYISYKLSVFILHAKLAILIDIQLSVNDYFKIFDMMLI